jgi:carbon-monoxide dehydrogenase medium subunit
VKPPRLRYARPGSLEEALDTLAGTEGARCLAGGQSLIPMLNLRLAEPMSLVDLARVPGLDVIERGGGKLRIGAMARHRAVEYSSEVRAAEPLLCRAAREIGHLAIRNRGTIGGSLAHADPVAEWPLVAVTLGAEIVLRSRGGERVVGAREFFTGSLTTALRAGEILVEARFAEAGAKSRFGFQELCRRPGDFAVVAVACRVELDDDGACRAATLGVAGANPTPIWIPAVAQVLNGRRGEDDVLRDAAEAARRAVDPGSDLQGSAEYRRRMVGVLVERALRDAWSGQGQAPRNDRR